MYQFIKEGSVSTPEGFKAAGIHSGIKKQKKDLALIYSEKACTAAGTYTLNKVKAAPLIISQNIVDSGQNINAILINSGNANACTGEAGFHDALESQSVCAEQVGTNKENVLIASTGVIGQRLPMDKLLSGIKKVSSEISKDGGMDAAEAIMTTDTRVKSFAATVYLSEGVVNIGAICKGSGMIAPNMATMLAFITTDAKIEKTVLQEMLSASVDETFNKISVDGETSTNDMVLLLANGAAGVGLSSDKDKRLFGHVLTVLCREMAKSIVSDGEGATKLVTVNILNAKSKIDADLVGKSIANSALVKTAITGADANWGRILSAAGKSGADIDPAKVSISFNDYIILNQNYNLLLDEKLASSILSQPEFEITVDLGIGSENTTWWTCDLTEEYVKINANYRT